MSNGPVKVLAVVGSSNVNSVTRTVIQHVAPALSAAGCSVDLLDLSMDPLPIFVPGSTHEAPYYQPLRARVAAADVYLLGTPDYHGSISGVMKNFLDHFWGEFAGKLFATIVASAEKGLTVTDQLRTVARQCYAWSLPYGVAFSEKEDIREGQVVGDALINRLGMLCHDLNVYGRILSAQRAIDLAGTDPGFMARYRK